MTTDAPTTPPSSPSQPVRRCATGPVHNRLLREVPEYAENRAAVENAYFFAHEAFDGVLRAPLTTIPLVVHLVGGPDGAGAVTDEQVQNQLDVLNEDYSARNPDAKQVPEPFQALIADSRIRFVLADIDPDGEPCTGINRVPSEVVAFSSDDDAVKFTPIGGVDAWPAEQYLNLWVCGLAGGLLGYAQFPGGPPETDGVVIHYTAFGTDGTAEPPFDLGRTATHAIGHWLNLRHIWGDDDTGCSGSDFVGDTPNSAGPNSGLPTFPSISCNNGPAGDLFMNFMDYTDDVGMMMFTTGQAFRMHAAARPTFVQ